MPRRSVRRSVACLLAAAACAVLVTGGPVPARAEIVRLTVVHTNDVHGGIDPTGATYMSRDFPPRLGGGASLITLLERVRRDVERKGGHLLVLDAGDIFQGTPVGTLTRGRAVVDFMNGHPPRAWWEFTPERKKRFPDV